MRRFFCLPKILPLFTKPVSGRCPVAEMYSLRKGYNMYIYIYSFQTHSDFLVIEDAHTSEFLYTISGAAF